MGEGFARPSGSWALDLVNTIDWRDDPARRIDLLTSARAFAEWTEHVGLPVVRRVRWSRVNALRETLAAVFRAVARGDALPKAALAQWTRWTQSAWRHRELVEAGSGIAWRWRAGTDAADRVLFEICLEAVELLLSPERERVHLCEGPGCGWMFVDRSKAGRRRWCDMALCGNRAKAREFRARESRD